MAPVENAMSLSSEACDQIESSVQLFMGENRLDEMNALHPNHRPGAFDQLRHYVLTFTTVRSSVLLKTGQMRCPLDPA
jgi:hypothetical protein